MRLLLLLGIVVLLLGIVVGTLLGNLIFFWIMTRIDKKLQKEEEIKEPIFMGEDENGNGIYKFE